MTDPFVESPKVKELSCSHTVVIEVVHHISIPQARRLMSPGNADLCSAQSSYHVSEASYTPRLEVSMPRQRLL